MTTEKQYAAAEKFRRQDEMLANALSKCKIDQERFIYGMALVTLNCALVYAKELAQQGNLEESKERFADARRCFLEVIRYAAHSKPFCDKVTNEYQSVSRLLDEEGLN